MAFGDSSSSSSRPPAWRHYYEAVLQTHDRSELFHLIELAEAAIRTRHKALEQAGAFYPQERDELESAAAHLGLLRKEQTGSQETESLGSNDPAAQNSASCTEWRRHFAAVQQETDTPALFKRVEVAEASILVYRDTLDQVAASHEERRALDEALAYLAEVKKQRLRFL